MATYRNKNETAVDIYQSIDFEAEKLRWSIGKVKPDEKIEAVLLASDPRFLVVASGGYAYKSQFSLVSAPPPPPPPTGEEEADYITSHRADGSVIDYFDRRNS